MATERRAEAVEKGDSAELRIGWRAWRWLQHVQRHARQPLVTVETLHRVAVKFLVNSQARVKRSIPLRALESFVGHQLSPVPTKNPSLW
jgi:hypothetical protein